jgi:asparagine synthase (glutamine-hydrolysing)
VLLDLVSKSGAAGLDRVDGMLALAYYDLRDRSLLLARDIFGEKPLYYFETDEIFAFASELSALALVPGFDLHIDAEAIANYLAFQYIPAPRTIYRGARKLPPGSHLTLDASGISKIRRDFRFTAAGPSRAARPLADRADELEAILIKSVQRRLISDVPIGAFLSGGVDSSTVVALASKVMRAPVKTFTIGFDGHAESEHLEAAAIARHLGTAHHERLLHPDGIALCEHVGMVLDEPNGDTSCLPTLLLSKFAREQVTVAISGDGGDELFGGYGRYLATVQESEQRERAGGMEWWTPATAYWSSRILVFPDAEIATLAGSMPPGLAADLNGLREAMDADERPLVHRMREADAAHYMPGAVLAKVDRMSMQPSLEVRAPLLGREVAAFASGLASDECVSDGQGKLVLKEVARRYLPDGWMRRPKRGFGLPMGLWGAATLMPAARRLLDSQDCRLTGWIPNARLKAYLDRAQTDFNAYRVWSLLILEHWLRAHPHKVGERFPIELTAPRPARLAPSLRHALKQGRRLLFGARGAR